MRFPDFLRTTVMLCAAAATVLALITIAGVNGSGDPTLLMSVSVGWWIAAAVAGSVIGRRHTTSHQIAVLLAAARTQSMLPEINPSRVVLNRLWPIIACTIVGAVVAFAYPQVPAIATGFAIIWALAWRRQVAAVSAVEERDGVRFYVERTPPLRPIKLVRTPGFRTNLPEMKDARRSGPVVGRHA